MCHAGLELHLAASDVMTIAELAEYLKVSKSSLYKLVQQSKVPGQKVGKHWRFRRDVIDHWLAGQSDGFKAKGGAV